MIIDGRKIGQGNAPYVIAEVASEHCGSLEKAFALVDAADDAGAGAVKFQLYDPTRLAGSRGGARKTLASGPWAGRTLLDLYTEAHTPSEWFPDLFAYAKEIGITLFSSVFDGEGVEYLEKLGCPAYKISSFEVTDCDLVREAASTSKPLIISTGMASDDEIRLAWLASRQAPSVAFLHCISAYPAPIGAANLRRIVEIGMGYDGSEMAWKVGLSDHTLGHIAPVVATALGASIIEKHITLDRNNGGPDAQHSLEPAEFKVMVDAVKDAYASLGNGQPSDAEAPYRSLRRKA